jgi:outer membrane lipoprotein carrier protein
MILLLLLFASPPDPLAPVIARLETRYNHMDSLRASFTQQYRSDERSAIREESGVVYLRKPGQMRWDYVKPEVKQFFCSGKEAYFYAPADHQATRFSVKESTDARIPLRFLLGRLNLRHIFAKVELAVDQAPLDPGDPVLKLWPKKGETFRDVYLEIDAQSRIRRLIIDDADGSRSDFHLSAEEPNPRLDSNLFLFVAPPGVTIVDERSGQ